MSLAAGILLNPLASHTFTATTLSNYKKIKTWLINTIKQGFYGLV